MSRLSEIANKVMDQAEAELAAKAAKKAQEKKLADDRANKLDEEILPMLEAYVYAYNKTCIYYDEKYRCLKTRYEGSAALEIRRNEGKSIKFSVHLTESGYLLKGLAFDSTHTNAQMDQDAVLDALTVEIQKQSIKFKRHLKAYVDKQERKKLPLLQRWGIKKPRSGGGN